MKNDSQTPKKIHISKELNKYGSLESLSNEIIDALNEGYTDFNIEISHGYYDSYDVSLQVSGTRLETEEEVNRRLDAELKIKTRQKARTERSKKLKEEQEKKEYERLRKKFESSTQS